MKPILIVVAPYYTEIAKQLVAGAKAVLDKANHGYELVEVPGALEIPSAIGLGVASNRFSGFIALGCVLRGETTHYETVANESARGLMELSLRYNAAIGNGILTCETEEQAVVRADVKQGNKGAEAANAALRLLALRAQFGVAS